MSRLRGLARFLWDFLVGDDPRLTAAVVIALAIAALVGHAGWIVLVLLIVLVLSASVAAGARVRPPG